VAVANIMVRISEVFILSRDSYLSIKPNHHNIVWLEEDQFLFLDRKLPIKVIIIGIVS
jgi:hypothetical protein